MAGNCTIGFWRGAVAVVLRITVVIYLCNYEHRYLLFPHLCRLESQYCTTFFLLQFASHPQIAQNKQHRDLRNVLRQTPIADGRVPKLALDKPERVHNSPTDTHLPALALLPSLPVCGKCVQVPTHAS